MSFLRRTADGTIVSVHVQPNAGRERIVGFHGEALKIAITAPPEKGKANKAIISLLAKALSISRSSINIVSGDTDSRKTLVIKGLKFEAFLNKLKKQVE